MSSKRDILSPTKNDCSNNGKELFPVSFDLITNDIAKLDINWLALLLHDLLEVRGHNSGRLMQC